MKVRPAIEADLDAITRVQARTMVWCGFYRDSIDEASEYERLHPRVSGYFRGAYHPSHALAPRAMFVAEDDDHIVGFVAGHLSTRMDCEGELQWMFVLPEWHRQGIGSRLLGPLARWFAEQERTHVIVDAPPGNPFRGFYLKQGAVPLDEYWLHWLDIQGNVASSR